jgi:hypothetical protein
MVSGCAGPQTEGDEFIMRAGNGFHKTGKGMTSNSKRTKVNRRLGLVLGSILLAGLLLASPASAEFNYIFFGVNGDTSLTSMTQGDEFFWASNCDTGATINWEIWYDANSNSTIDPSIDPLLNSENMTDGNPATDAVPDPDGYVFAAPFVLSGEPGVYIFKATDLATDSSLQRMISMVAMSSPPNQFAGTISLEGISAPDALLANRMIFAEADGADGAYLAITNNMGSYSMNVDGTGTGLEFYFRPSNVPGFVTPTEISAVASGVVGGNNFSYEAAADSVWGFVKDDLGAVLNFETSVAAYDQSSWKMATTLGGKYAIYFADTDGGEWTIEPDGRYSPLYVTPEGTTFDLDTLTSFEHDVILHRADAIIYARVTENGGQPANNYRVDAYSTALGAWTEAVSGTGSDNIATLHVSSADPSGWYISINQFDDDFPIPDGLALKGGWSGASPGDTVTLELINGNLISGNVTSDPDDGPVNWEDFWVSTGIFGGNINPGGSYGFYVDTGVYNLAVWADGYIANPQYRWLHVTGDTTVGLNFTVNKAHCTVTGSLTGLSLPLESPWYAVTARTGNDYTDGYYVTAYVDSATGTYELNLCDGDWTIFPPCCIPGAFSTDSAIVTIGESPDTLRTADFAYTSFGCCTGITGNIDGDPGELIDIADVTYLIDYLWITNTVPVCFEEANMDGDPGGLVDIADLTRLIAYLWIPPNVPPAPCQ